MVGVVYGRRVRDALGRRHPGPLGDAPRCERPGRGGPWPASLDQGPSGGAGGCTTGRRIGRNRERLRWNRSDLGRPGGILRCGTGFKSKLKRLRMTSSLMSPAFLGTRNVFKCCRNDFISPSTEGVSSPSGSRDDDRHAHKNDPARGTTDRPQ